MTKYVQHFFRCFLSIQDPFVENSLFISLVHYLIELFGSLESNFLCSLYILDISSLSDVGLVKIFFSWKELQRQIVKQRLKE